MKAVLYTYDMEPITVISLSPFAQDRLMREKVVRLPVVPMFSSTDWSQEEIVEPVELKSVTIRAEPLYANGGKHMLLFTNDEESALLLKSVFLPGQTSALNDRDRKAFAAGFMRAVELLG